MTGALLEFIFNIDPIDVTEQPSSSGPGGKSIGTKKGSGGIKVTEQRNLTARQRLGGQSLLALWAASGVVMTIIIGGWWYFLPLTYGKPGLTAEQVVARKWLGYDLHFAK